MRRPGVVLGPGQLRGPPLHLWGEERHLEGTMKPLLAGLTILLLTGLAATAEEARKPANEESAKAGVSPEPTLPDPAGKGGYFQRGGADIGRGYGYGAKKLARGTAGFGKNFARFDFDEAGRSFGRGAAGFGKGVGIGTARGFKNFGLAFRSWGKKIDPAPDDGEADRSTQAKRD